MISKVFYPQEGKITSYSEKVGYVGVTPLILNGSYEIIYVQHCKKDDADLIKLMEQFELFNSDDIDLNYQVNNKSLSSDKCKKLHL